MKLTIINIANKMPNWVITACNEYLRRLNNSRYSCQVIEIKSSKVSHKGYTNNISVSMAIEAQKIAAYIATNSFIIVLDESGDAITSVKFADKLKKIMYTHSHITFIIGGADGIDASLKDKAHLRMQLSALTLPHALVRVVILEQIYRAVTMLDNHPYHRN